MKTLVIPDIHTKWQKADQLIKSHVVDEVVCLGDYFDDFGDNPEINKRTAEWLKEFIDSANHIALFGNHELNYMHNRVLYQCSGYSSSKKWKINQVLTSRDWHQLKPYCVTQGWHITHAGISQNIGCNPQHGWNPISFAEKVKSQMELFIMNSVDYIFEAGLCRGGLLATGGITWCHFPDEFKPIPEIKQLFGHTPGSKPRQYPHTHNWCIDTHLKHYAIIEDGELKIFEV